MIRFASVLCMTALLGLGASQAAAQQEMDAAQENLAEKPPLWYFNAALGVSSMLEEDIPDTDISDTGLAGRVAFGRKLSPLILELAGTLYSHNMGDDIALGNEEDITLDTRTTTLNVLLDIPAGSAASFYAGLGFGFASYELTATDGFGTITVSPDETDAALAVPVGVKYQIADQWALGFRVTHTFIFVEDDTLNYRSFTFGGNYLF